MARVIRGAHGFECVVVLRPSTAACWAYKRPHVKVLPIRDDYNIVYNYEKHQATPEFFPER